MDKECSTLGDDVLSAFDRACNEGNLRVAEYLLRALEALGERDEGAAYVERALCDLAHSLGSGPCH